MFYATPIVYAAQDIPAAFQMVMKLNPMAHIINGYRSIFYYQTMPDLKALFILLAISVVACIAGYFIFRKLQKGFAEEL